MRMGGHIVHRGASGRYAFGKPDEHADGGSEESNVWRPLAARGKEGVEMQD